MAYMSFIRMLASPLFSAFFIFLLKYKFERNRQEWETETRQATKQERETKKEQKRQAAKQEQETKKEQKRQAAKLERDRAMDEIHEKLRVMEEKLEREKRERIEGDKKTEMMIKSLAQMLEYAIRLFEDILLRQQMHGSSSRYQRLEYRELVKLLAHFELPEDSDMDLQSIFDASYLESSKHPKCGRNSEDDILCVINQAMTIIKGEKNSQDITALELHNQLFDNLPMNNGNDIVSSAMTPMNNGTRAKEEGNAYFKEQKFEEAIECYSKSINELPTIAAYGNRAMAHIKLPAHIKLNKFIEAEKDCTEALKMDDRYFKTYARRAMARTKLGCNLEGALEDVEVALELESNNLEMKKLHFEIMSLKAATEAKEEGNNLFKDQKFEEAIICYSVSINKSPTSKAYNNRAMAYLKLDKLMEAENDWTEALKIDNNYFKAYARRAIARSKLGCNLKEALEDVEVALNLKPNNQEMMVLHAKQNQVLAKGELHSSKG